METVGHNFGGPEKRRGLGLQVSLCSLYQTKLRTDPPALGFCFLPGLETRIISANPNSFKARRAQPRIPLAA